MNTTEPDVDEDTQHHQIEGSASIEFKDQAARREQLVQEKDTKRNQLDHRFGARTSKLDDVSKNTFTQVHFHPQTVFFF